MIPQLCLGTAQFGLAYGITNTAGQVSEEVVPQLLAEAELGGIRLLDTAQAYGDAEILLGRHLPDMNRFRLISKLPAQPQLGFCHSDKDSWELAYHASCQRMRVQRFDSLLLHDPADLRKPGGHYLKNWLLDLRERGFVDRIGVSIYAAEDLKGVNPELLDLVQLPLSLLDQRLLQNGTVDRLHAQGTKIHARSVYLQGLVLAPAEQWPDWVTPEVRAHQQALQALAKQKNCQLIDLALGFAHEQKDLEAVVLGVCSVQELRELQQAWKASSPWHDNESQTWGIQDPVILDPRRWPR